MKKLQKISLFALLTAALLIPALVTSCQVPDTGDGIPDGYGAVQLNITGISNMRTILPTTVVGDFLSYKLTFTPTSGSVVVENVAKADIATTVVHLTPGTYSLEVIAYMSAGQVGPAANYTASGITIAEHTTQTLNIALTAYSPSTATGNGTFSWNITTSGIANLDTATMKINEMPGNSLVEQIDLETNPNDSKTDLTAGYYEVVFNIATTSKTLEFKQSLWIYQNMTSSFAFTFTNAHFGAVQYTIEYNYNDTGVASPTYDYAFSGTVTPPNPTWSGSEGYNFEGWFEDNGTWLQPFDSSTTINKNFTVYAKWDGLAAPSGSPSLNPVGGTPLAITYIINSGVSQNVVPGTPINIANGDTVAFTITNATSFTGITWTHNADELSNTGALTLDDTPSVTELDTSAAGTYLIFVEATEGAAPQSTYFTLIIAQ